MTQNPQMWNVKMISIGIIDSGLAEKLWIQNYGSGIGVDGIIDA